MDPIVKIYLKTIILLVIINLLGFFAVLILFMVSAEPKEPEVIEFVRVSIPESYISEYVLPDTIPIETPEPEVEDILEEVCDMELIHQQVLDICARYPNVDPAIIMSIIWHESRFQPNATNTNHLGLMQVSTRWHKDRAERLGVTDFYDSYSSILLGVDYISELTTSYKDLGLVLMLYNMNHKTAFSLFKEGRLSNYAQSVMDRAHIYQKGE
jgi:hypothetical protein